MLAPPLPGMPLFPWQLTAPVLAFPFPLLSQDNSQAQNERTVSGSVRFAVTLVPEEQPPDSCPQRAIAPAIIGLLHRERFTWSGKAHLVL